MNTKLTCTLASLANNASRCSDAILLDKVPYDIVFAVNIAVNNPICSIKHEIWIMGYDLSDPKCAIPTVDSAVSDIGWERTKLLGVIMNMKPGHSHKKVVSFVRGFGSVSAKVGILIYNMSGDILANSGHSILYCPVY